MADGFIQVPPDSTGKFLDTSELTVGINTVERQRLVLADPTTASALLPLVNASIDGTGYAAPTRNIVNKRGAIETTTLLGSNAAFTGAWRDSTLDGTNYVRVTVFTDKASSSNGFQIQQTNDTGNANLTEVSQQVGVIASTLTAIDAVIKSRYWRVVYTNGPTAQTSFEIAWFATQIPFIQNKDFGRQAIYFSGQGNPSTNQNIIGAGFTYNKAASFVNTVGNAMPYIVPPGKTFRLTSLNLFFVDASSTINNANVFLVCSPQAPIVGSTVFASISVGTSVANGNGSVSVDYPDGIDIASGLQVSMWWNTGGTSTINFRGVGFEY